MSILTPPQLALRIGITGHRELSDGVAAQLRARVRDRLRDIKCALKTAKAKTPDTYADLPILLRAVSPLAEGADRIFAKEAIDLGYRLECPLPFPCGEYCKTFSGGAKGLRDFIDLLRQAETVFELDGVKTASGAAYETVGSMVLDHSDILLAIWDGEPAKGSGGTANIVALARKRQIPVFWLHTDARKPDTLILSGSSDDSSVLDERCIEAIVGSLTTPPWDAGTGEGETGGYAASHMGDSSFLGYAWHAFEKTLSSGAKYPSFPAPSVAARVCCDPFAMHYDEVDRPAKRLAGLYRGAFLMNYFLGVLAVFLALLSYAAHRYALYWGIAELTVIVSILWIVHLVIENRWHHRTVDCRYFAEQLRILRFIYPLGLSATSPRLPAHYVHSNQRSWMEWRLRAALRHTRMPAGRITKAYLKGCYAEILDDWLAGQIRYHARNARKMELMEHRLHKLGEYLFYGAFLACAMHLLCEESAFAPWLTLFAAGLPAAAAACHGVAGQGEFRRLAKRSESMSQSLDILSAQLKKLESANNLTGATLREQAALIAQVMLEEVVDWQILYRKPVEPA